MTKVAVMIKVLRFVLWVVEVTIVKNVEGVVYLSDNVSQ